MLERSRLRSGSTCSCSLLFATAAAARTNFRRRCATCRRFSAATGDDVIVGLDVIKRLDSRLAANTGEDVRSGFDVIKRLDSRRAANTGDDVRSGLDVIKRLDSRLTTDVCDDVSRGCDVFRPEDSRCTPPGDSFCRHRLNSGIFERNVKLGTDFFGDVVGV